jgi:hypothetical protein
MEKHDIVLSYCHHCTVTVWQNDGDSTMVTVWQYDGDSMTVWWWQYDSTMVTVWQYDGDNTTDCHYRADVCRHRTVVLLPSYCRTITIVLSRLALFVLTEKALALTEHRSFALLTLLTCLSKLSCTEMILSMMVVLKV